MMKSGWAPFLGLTMMTLAGCSAAKEAVRPEQPNIVFIISDDHDNDHLGFMGNATVHTPNIDRLAEAGTVFTHAHLPMSRCHPALASFLSGVYPHQSGIYYNYGAEALAPVDSLPHLLREAGYATYVEGKYWEGMPREMGFTHGKGKTADTFVRDGQDSLFAFLDEVSGVKPFFVWWAPKIPHTPHNPPEKYLALFEREKIPAPEWIPAGQRESFLNREHKSLAMEAWLDDGIGQLEAKLREIGAYEETMFLFVIDNGWCNGLVSKGSVFEKGLRTPVFFTWPGRIEGARRFDTLTSTLDLFPTILDYAGARVPDRAVGNDLRPIIEGERTENRRQLFGAIYPAFATEDDQRPERDIYAIYTRDERWKYVLYLQDVVEERNRDYFRIQYIETEFPARVKGDEDLYDLEADPHELENLAGRAENRERMDTMRAAALQWWRETGGGELDVR